MCCESTVILVYDIVNTQYLGIRDVVSDVRHVVLRKLKVAIQHTNFAYCPRLKNKVKVHAQKTVSFSLR